MLYIFLVETGSMMTFDMNLALQTVTNLKKAIESQCQIPEDRQVLLISGGESLNLTSRVCSYSCSGTDTSPIFLFSKNSIDCPNPPKCVTEYDPDVDMSDRVHSCIDMHPNYNTVVARAEMAQQLYEMAKQQLHNCERLVHDQHLQQQGWAAVVANLEDIANSFSDTSVKLEEMFHQFIEEKTFYTDLLQNFNNDIKTLAMIPMLTKLLSNNRNTNEDNSEERHTMTLLEWISQKDNQNSLEQVAQHCTRGLEQFDLEQLSKIKEEVEEVLDSCNQSNMKEVKGLEERLYGLEKLMCEAKKVVEEQRDLAQAFYQNQTRATNLRDPSILPDLCASHQQQLQVMLKNHKNLRDIRRRCARAKEELSGNLHARLRWIVFIEKRLSEIDSKIIIYSENIRRLKKHLEVVHQIHLSPKIYLSAVVEVVRRKTFSDVFLRWASGLSEQSSQLVEKEIQLRQTFSTQLDSHFLQILFPGLNDFPPRFANESPVPFDTDLPNLTDTDVEYLRQNLPDLCDLLCVPSSVPMPQSSDPMDRNNPKVGAIELKPSESDAEEFETVNEDFDNRVLSSVHEIQTKQMNTELMKNNENLIRDHMRDVFTEMSPNSEETETNIKNIRTELEEKSNELKELQKSYDKIENELNLRNNWFQSLLKVSFDSIETLKDTKTSFVEQYSDISNEYLSSFESLKQQINEWLLHKESQLNEKQLEFNKTVEEYDKQLSEVKGSEQSMKSEINSMKDIIESLNKSIESLNEEIINKKKELIDLKEEKSNNEKQLTLEHELEMTSLTQDMTKLNESMQTLEESISSKESQINSMKQNYEKLESDLLVRFQEEKDSLKTAMNKDFNEREEILKNEFNSKLKDIECNNESIVCEIRSQLEDEKKKCLNELKERLDSEHKHEMECLRHRFKLAISTTSIERTPSESSLEKVNLDVVDQLAQEREVMKLKQLVLDEKTRYEEMIIKYKKERDEEVKQLKSEMAAKRQVSFNEALNKLSNEREFLAQEVKTKDNCLNSSLSVINELISKFHSSEVSERTEKQTNEILLKIETEIKSLTDNFGQKLNESVICDSRSQCSCNSVNLIREKESEIIRLNKVLRDTEMSQSSSAIGRIERVSVLGCEVGDIVLIYYEDKYDNYLVFHLNNVLHFLHTDCLEALALKSASGEPRQHWTIAEVTDKEYCQARKTENRYRVALNTKFYRVKAKPWNRFVAIMNRSTESRNSFSVTLSSKQLSPKMSGSMSASNVSNMSTSFAPIDIPKRPDNK